MTRTDSADFRILYGDLSADGRRLVADVATQLGTHLGEVRRATNARILVELPELARAPDELRDGLDRSTDAHVTLLRGMLGAWADPSETTSPPEAIDWAKDLAHQGFPVEALLKVYRIGHACLWQIWLRLLTAQTSDPALLAEASAATSAFMFIYVEAILTPIVGAHQAGRERLLRHTQSVAEGSFAGFCAATPSTFGARANDSDIGWMDGTSDSSCGPTMSMTTTRRHSSTQPPPTWSNGSASRAMPLSCRQGVRCCMVGWAGGNSCVCRNQQGSLGCTSHSANPLQESTGSGAPTINPGTHVEWRSWGMGLRPVPAIAMLP